MDSGKGGYSESEFYFPEEKAFDQTAWCFESYMSIFPVFFC